MRNAIIIAVSTLLVLFSVPTPVGAAHCGTPPEDVHTYGLAGSASATTAERSAGAGVTIVFDNNTFDCDGNGLPDDFDGDYEFGVGGAYFGIAGNEQVNTDCGLGLHLHVATGFGVDDAVVASVRGAAGYEGQDADELDPCVTDGVIGDDVADCIEPFIGGGSVDPCRDNATIGLNLDAGIWIFLDASVSTVSDPAVTVAVTGTVRVC